MTATRNACKLCQPLGAALAFQGIEGAVSILHGSQGCSTYIRRYMISHFREPLDLASSNFTEEAAVFGGKSNLHLALDNLEAKYHPSVIGVATTCLAETIGEDMPRLVREYQETRAARKMDNLPIVWTSTASYRGSHADGYQAALRSLVAQLAETGEPHGGVNLFPNMVSPEDLRFLKRLLESFGLHAAIIPDYSRTLDGGPWTGWVPIPKGGTPLAKVVDSGCAKASIEFAAAYTKEETPGGWLASERGVPLSQLGIPIGVRAMDALVDTLEKLAGQPAPEWLEDERGRLVDSLADAHKYLRGKKAVVFGEEDLVAGICGFLAEAGAECVVAASGGDKGRLERALDSARLDGKPVAASVSSGADFLEIEDRARELGAEIAIGNSKGFKLAKALDIPLVRVGFPVHDRFGGARIGLLGYGGTLNLLDRIMNAFLEVEQKRNPVGYTYFG